MLAILVMFQSPGSIFLKLGPVTIRWYGVMIALGFITASFALSRLAKKTGQNAESLINCAIACFIGGIIGARLYFVTLSWSYFQNHLWEICATWNGGLSIHGGIIGAVIAGCIYAYIYKLPALQYADILTSVAPLGQAIGRWGNFFNSEAFGKPVADNFPLRLFIPSENRPMAYLQNDYFHPTFLYESIWDFALFGLLYFIALPRLAAYPGLSFLLYIAGYSLGRMLIEPLRVDSIMIGNLQAPLVVSAANFVLALVAIVFLVFLYRRRRS
jgi:phosphatidylglycerol---prolipoprotein diacylglyceryl transferase